MTDPQLPELQCPHCHNHFQPQLPQRPELPPEILDNADTDTTPGPASMNMKIFMLTGILAQLAQTLRNWGFNATATGQGMEWNLNVTTPDIQIDNVGDVKVLGE